MRAQSRAAGLLMLVLVTCSSPGLLAADYYVKNGGDDGADGLSDANAWATLARVNAVMGGFEPGDTIHFQRGSRWREPLQIRSSGSPGTPITFTSYGTGSDPVINGATLEVGWSPTSVAGVHQKVLANQPMIVAEDDMLLTYLHWNGDLATTFSGAANGSWSADSNTAYVLCTDGGPPDSHVMEVAAQSGAERYGIVTVDASHVVVEGFTVKYTTVGGVEARTVSSSSRDIIVRNCTAHATGGTGIGTNPTGNNAHDDMTSIRFQGNAVSYARKHGLMFARGTSDSLMDHNVVHHCGWGGTGVGGTGGHNISQWGAGTTVNPRNNVIEYNTSHHCIAAADGTEGAGIQCDDNTQDSHVRYNLSYANEGSAFYDNGLSGNQWYYNVGIGSGTQPLGDFRGGLTISDANGTKVYNNVLFDNAPTGLGWFNGSQVSLEIKNNIIFENADFELRSGSGASAGLTSDYNLVFHSAGGAFMRYEGGSYDWEGYLDASGLDVNSSHADPLLVDAAGGDFHLTVSSPAIDRGTDVGLDQDREGYSVPQGAAVDIGAHEYGEPPDAGPYDAGTGGDGAAGGGAQGGGGGDAGGALLPTAKSDVSGCGCRSGRGTRSGLPALLALAAAMLVGAVRRSRHGCGRARERVATGRGRDNSLGCADPLRIVQYATARSGAAKWVARPRVDRISK